MDFCLYPVVLIQHVGVSVNMNHIVCVISLVFAQTVLEYLCHYLAHAWEQDSPQQAKLILPRVFAHSDFPGGLWKWRAVHCLLRGAPPKSSVRFPVLSVPYGWPFPHSLIKSCVIQSFLFNANLFGKTWLLQYTIFKVRSDQTLLNGPTSKLWSVNTGKLQRHLTGLTIKLSLRYFAYSISVSRSRRVV